MNSPPPKPEVILTNFFAEPTVLLVPITSRGLVETKTDDLDEIIIPGFITKFKNRKAFANRNRGVLCWPLKNFFL